MPFLRYDPVGYAAFALFPCVLAVLLIETRERVVQIEAFLTC